MAEAFTPRLGLGGERLGGQSPLRALGRMGLQVAERAKFGGDQPVPAPNDVGDAGLWRTDQRAAADVGPGTNWIGFDRATGEPKIDRHFAGVPPIGAELPQVTEIDG